MFNFRLPDFLFLLCLQCIALGSYAQYDEPNTINFGVNDGLPSSTCYDLVQDDKGFLWISSEGGLTRYDGYTFKNYNTSDGLVDNEVISLQKDESGRLWMNTNGPLSYMLDDSVYVVPSEENSELNYDFKIVEDSNYIWVNRVSGLWVYDKVTLDSIEINIPEIGKNLELKLVGKYDDAIWVIIDKMLCKYSGAEISARYPIKSMSYTAKRHTHFSIHGHYMYFTDNDMLHRLNLNTLEESSVTLLDGLVRKIISKDDKLWVLTYNSLNEFSLNDTGKITQKNKILEGSLASKFLFDDSNNLWATIYKHGLIMIPKNNNSIKHTQLGTNSSNNLESILVDGDEIILGTEKGTLYVLNEGEISQYNISDTHKLGVNRIVDIISVPNNGFLISKDTGLYHFKNGKIRKLIDGVAKNIFIKGKRLLVNTYNKLFEFNVDSLLSTDVLIDTKYFYGKHNIIQAGRSYTSIISEDDKIWNASVLGGLTVIDEKDTFSFKNSSSIFNSTIARLIELDSGIVCAVTKGEGLILIKGKTFKTINEKNGLSSNFCYDIDASDNQIYVATNKGVSVIDLIDFDRFEFGVRTVDIHNGLISNEVQDIAVRDSTLHLATNKGYVTYQLSSKEMKVSRREVYIENFSVNGESIPLVDDYVLNAHDNNITINLISPSIGSKKDNIYTYKLEGVDENWIKTTSSETHYRNLEQGKYQFMYKDGATNDYTDVKSVTIEIEPRVIHSSWFKIMILATLGCLFMVPLYLSYSSQKRSLLANLLTKKSDEVNEKMRLLEKSNKRLVSSNKELEQFAYIASHDLQEPINTIKGFTEVLTKRIETTDDPEALKMLAMISNSSTRMKELVRDLLVYSRIGKEKTKSMVDMNSLMEAITKDLTDRIESNNATVTWDRLPYLPGYQVELRSLIQNLLSNAMKFQRPGVPPKIHISSTKIQDGVEFSVKDNGIGISEEYKDRIFEIFQRLHNKDQYEGTGIGLAHCKKIVNLHNGRIWVESVPEGGSNFKFTIEV